MDPLEAQARLSEARARYLRRRQQLDEYAAYTVDVRTTKEKPDWDADCAQLWSGFSVRREQPTKRELEAYRQVQDEIWRLESCAPTTDRERAYVAEVKESLHRKAAQCREDAAEAEATRERLLKSRRGRSTGREGGKVSAEIRWDKAEVRKDILIEMAKPHTQMSVMAAVHLIRRKLSEKPPDPGDPIESTTTIWRHIRHLWHTPKHDKRTVSRTPRS